MMGSVHRYRVQTASQPRSVAVGIDISPSLVTLGSPHGPPVGAQGATHKHTQLRFGVWGDAESLTREGAVIRVSLTAFAKSNPSRGLAGSAGVRPWEECGRLVGGGR